ncbi:MAG: 2-succinyl-5-enolpyruvyl-6-hydroxy-3-cyclohexene-1-carboxylic-acid synthase [Verrucomicrobia bacterium]|nr:2-succinyl-5-enolpyruvyl-6-hydroxy-3-cyclohexene-1-carboxylic-acid synthase [Verrucomicrobiota bacterium]
MDTGVQNEGWASKLIDALIRQGVDYFCCAPGSRSTPLALAIANHPKAKRTVHFDERGVAFHAVGYGKATHRPAAVVATSGTAVGNLLPAVMEAYNDRVPLVLLTADRPPELRDCGANQTCDQVKLFQNHVRWQVDLPCPDERILDKYLAATISHAVAMTGACPSGPVHINCMFREPLFSHQIEREFLDRTVSFAHPQLHPTDETIEFWASILCAKREGVILAGSSTIDHSDAIFALADKLKWPVFADILASPRTFEKHPSLITHFDPILKLKTAINANAVIQFGDRFVSKTLSQWLDRQTPEFFLHVSEHTMRQDPTHLITHRVHASPQIFTRELLFALPEQEDASWLLQWAEWDQKCKQTLADFFSSHTTLTEPGLIWEIASFLSEDWAMFLSNSMPIRDANQFFLPALRCGPIFGNRGVSGIDGNIATAAGIAQGSGRPTLAVLGDLSLLHDLTSLNYLAKVDHPIILCIVNNGGGGIFSFLPVSKRKEAFEEFIAASHELSFAPAAELFGIPYFHPESPAELGDLLFQQKKQPHSCLIEITTNRSENVRVHEHIIASLGTCLISENSPAEIPASLH